MSNIDKNAGEDWGQCSRRALQIWNVRVVCDLPRRMQNMKKKPHLMKKMNQNQKKIKKNDANNHRKIMLSETEGRALLLRQA